MRTLILTLIAMVPFLATAQTIQEIQGESDSSPYLDMEVTTSGIVTASNADGFWIQDGTGMWSGIYVYDAENPAVGDDVTVTGTVDEFYELTEIVSVSNITVNSSGNDLPAAEVLNTGDVAQEGWEGVLIRVEGAECTNTDLGFGEWELNDGSGACRIDDEMFAFTPVAGTLYAVEGPQTYRFDNYKILPRDASDVSIDADIYFTKTPEEFDLTTDGMTVRWETNAAGDTQFEYGTTAAYELGDLNSGDLTTEHEVQLTGLGPAQVIYFRAKSANDDGETAWSSRVAVTVSESSGDIDVLFTQEPEISAATVSEAKWTSSIADSIANYIGMAQMTLEIAMYDLIDCDPVIMEAINDRVDAGVIVRYITDDEPENLALDLLNPEIPVLAGNTEGIMHDKFILIDRGAVDNAWVITGSTNHTGANMGWDYNDHIRIQDQSLALAYTLEFEEMWGSNGTSFDADAALFGSQKSDNTPHKFVIGGRDVELYFSPSDGTTGKIVEQLGAAEERVAFAVMAFTENSLGDAIVDADAALGDVQGVIDYVEFSGSEFDYLVDSGVDVVDYQNEDGSQWPDGPVMHSKYAICDYQAGDADPVTITGSHNWTASAGSINDENTLIIHDAEVANWYYQDFLAIRNFLGAVNVEEVAGELKLTVYPNPAERNLSVVVPGTGTLRVLDAMGREVLSQRVAAGTVGLELRSLQAGTYVVRVEGSAVRSARLIVR